MLHRVLPMLCVLALCIITSACVVSPPTASERPELLGDAVVVVINDPRSTMRRLGAGPGYQLPSAYADDPMLRRYAKAIASDYDLQILDQWPLRNLGVHCFLVQRPPEPVLAAVASDARVRWVQPFNEFALQANPDSGAATDRDCVLCEFTAQFRNPGFDVTIAVIDTAADMDHPDLRRSSLRTRNFAGRRGNPEEEQHGTAVVGLIAAIASHDQGLNGAAPGADVHLLRGCWQSAQGPGRCNTLTLALALDAAIDLQPDILNLSLTGRNDRVLDELLTILLANGTLVIAAHDDERAPSARFPLDHDGVVYAYGVADGEGVRTAISAPTPNLLFAPRHAVSLAPMGEYDLVSGHSIATPQLAAMAARLIQEESDHSRTDTINALQVWLNQYYRRLPAE